MHLIVLRFVGVFECVCLCMCTCAGVCEPVCVSSGMIGCPSINCPLVLSMLHSEQESCSIEGMFFSFMFVLICIYFSRLLKIHVKLNNDFASTRSF